MPVDVAHPKFPAPPPETVIWRYSSLAKLLSLFATESLFLPSLKTLQKDDPFEGLPTLQDRRLAERLSTDKDFANKFFKEIYPDFEASNHPNFREGFVSMLEGRALNLSCTCFVSCWHVRRHESAALWKLYSEFQGGIAIKSSIYKLCDAINHQKKFILGSVKYCDFDNTLADMTNALSPVFMKRESYEHEHEVRLLHWASEAKESELLAGISIECSPNKLIDEIVVSPYADDWLVETISAVVRRFELKFPVRKSRLMDTSL